MTATLPLSTPPPPPWTPAQWPLSCREKEKANCQSKWEDCAPLSMRKTRCDTTAGFYWLLNWECDGRSSAPDETGDREERTEAHCVAGSKGQSRVSGFNLITEGPAEAARWVRQRKMCHGTWKLQLNNFQSSGRHRCAAKQPKS